MAGRTRNSFQEQKPGRSASTHYNTGCTGSGLATAVRPRPTGLRGNRPRGHADAIPRRWRQGPGRPLLREMPPGPPVCGQKHSMGRWQPRAQDLAHVEWLALPRPPESGRGSFADPQGEWSPAPTRNPGYRQRPRPPSRTIAWAISGRAGPGLRFGRYGRTDRDRRLRGPGPYCAGTDSQAAPRASFPGDDAGSRPAAHWAGRRRECPGDPGYGAGRGGWFGLVHSAGPPPRAFPGPKCAGLLLANGALGHLLQRAAKTTCVGCHKPRMSAPVRPTPCRRLSPRAAVTLLFRPGRSACPPTASARSRK